jgi:hypothetical protein
MIRAGRYDPPIESRVLNTWIVLKDNRTPWTFADTPRACGAYETRLRKRAASVKADSMSPSDAGSGTDAAGTAK